MAWARCTSGKPVQVAGLVGVSILLCANVSGAGVSRPTARDDEKSGNGMVQEPSIPS